MTVIQGRSRPLSLAKQKLLDEVLPQFQLSLDTPFVPSACPIWLEIGFGKGEHLITCAEQNPSVLFLGCEFFLSGIASLLDQMVKQHLTNIRIIRDDARDVIAWLPDNCITKIDILFPDPWPKTRHHKRRLIHTETIVQLHRILKPSGLLTIATDHGPYLESILKTFQSPLLFDRIGSDYERPLNWVATRYEEKALSKGIKPAYLCFRKSA